MSKRYAVKVKAGAEGHRLNAKTGVLEAFPITKAISAGIEFNTERPVELAEGSAFDLIKSNKLLEIKPLPAGK